MKIKQTLFITEPDEFLRGDYTQCLNLYGDDVAPKSWIDCGPIDIEIDLDLTDMTAKAVQAIDAQIERETGKWAARLALLKRRKQELLALPAPDKKP